MTPRRVAITGLGVESPLGTGTDAVFARLCAGESGLALHRTQEEPNPLCMVAGLCGYFDAEARLGRPAAMSMDRHAQLGLAAAQAAWADSGLPARGEASDPRHGIAWGTALGGETTYERGYRELFIKGRTRVSPLAVVMGMNNAAPSHIAINLGLGGACLNYTLACASAAVAIGEAFRRVRSGEATVMLTGGSDSPHAYGVVRAWEAMQVMARADEAGAPDACRPFLQTRTGLVLSEGAAALVLEDWDHAVARGARIHAELKGYACNCDASHLVRPDPAGQTRALRLALDDAGIAPDTVDYVNAHGTATREGDPIEIAALRESFGAHAAQLRVSATKSMHGHLMGAAGAIEALITVAALAQGRVPPTRGDAATLDAACEGVRHVFGQAEEMPLRHALSSSFAFGGTNAVLAFGRAD